jgi:hypothetical protein
MAIEKSKQLPLPGMPEPSEKASKWQQSTFQLPNNTTSVVRVKKGS